MSDIPKPSKAFEGDIQRLFKDSTASPLPLNKQAAGAPNVLLVMLDDVGFGTCSTFGGPITTPGVDKVAAAGIDVADEERTLLAY